LNFASHVMQSLGLDDGFIFLLQLKYAVVMHIPHRVNLSIKHEIWVLLDCLSDVRSL
jgi:hypothetical protein